MNEPTDTDVQTPAMTGDVVLVLHALPDELPAVIRYRRALKCLLRAYKLRCSFVGDREPTTVVYVERPKRKAKAAQGG